MRPSVLLSATTVLSVPVADVWSFLADTDRLNRHLELPEIRFTPSPDRDRKGHFLAETRSFGMRLGYEEFPFDWVEGRYYRTLRRFPRGPIAELTVGIRLRPTDSGADEGTELETFARVRPRNVLGLIAARTVVRRRTTRDIVALARAFERHVRNPVANVAPTLPPPSLVDEVQLASRGEMLASAPVAAGAVEALMLHLRTASDLEVIRMRPFELADRWHCDRIEVLLLCLHVRAGLLDLSWSILCPRCRAVPAESSTLGSLPSEGHCETCEIGFDSDLARSVETRFSVNPAVRIARRATYCIGGPANTPATLAQLRLEAGERRREELTLAAGWLRLRCYQAGSPVAVEVVPAGGRQLTARCGIGRFEVAAQPVGAGSVVLEVTNALEVEALVVVERERWKDSAATAAFVTSLQGFKDLFPHEAVAPGEEVGIGHLAILFTDLRGSTRLYERIGDVPAFGFVQNHFRFLVDEIARHQGGIVKTMGDAVMASFAQAPDALAAAQAMQAGWSAFTSRFSDGDDVTLKIGIHAGPLVMINNDGRVDYFGGTVNVAARVQGARGGEVVISQQVLDDPGVATMLAASGCRSEMFMVELKGVAGKQRLHRLIGNPAAG